MKQGKNWNKNKQKTRKVSIPVPVHNPYQYMIYVWVTLWYIWITLWYISATLSGAEFIHNLFPAIGTLHGLLGKVLSVKVFFFKRVVHWPGTQCQAPCSNCDFWRIIMIHTKQKVNTVKSCFWHFLRQFTYAVQLKWLWRSTHISSPENRVLYLGHCIWCTTRSKVLVLCMA